MHRYYNANKAILVELAAENDKYLRIWSERFGSTVQHNPGFTSDVPPIAGLAAGPFSSIHHGYVMNDHRLSSAVPFSRAPDPGQLAPPGPYFNIPKYLPSPTNLRQQNGIQGLRAPSQSRPVSFPGQTPRKPTSPHARKKASLVIFANSSFKG